MADSKPRNPEPEVERLTLEEFRRRVEEVEHEPKQVTELVRRLVLSTIDDVTASLRAAAEDEPTREQGEPEDGEPDPPREP